MSKKSIISWNVNGIRAIEKKGFFESVEAMAPDILCLQETKASVSAASKVLEQLSEYKLYLNDSKARKGYSGTAILTKEEPISVKYDLGCEEHDQEGRVITAEYPTFYLITVYTPNSGAGLKRLDYRMTWDEYFLSYVKQLEKSKPVIVCGDLNVAHNEIDIARPKSNYNKSAGYTQKEIDSFSNYMTEGYSDAFRHFYPEEVKYSYWNYMFKSRDRNVGWRIDYFLVSNAYMDKVSDSKIHNEFMGSDHCPIELIIEE